MLQFSFGLVFAGPLFFLLIIESGIIGTVVRQPEGRAVYDSASLAFLSYVLFIPVSLLLYFVTIPAVNAIFGLGRFDGADWAVAAAVSLIANGVLKYNSIRRDIQWTNKFGYSVLAAIGIWAWQPLAIMQFGLLAPLMFAIAATAASLWLIWQPWQQH